MVEEQIFLQMEINMLENTKMVNLTAKGNTYGLMEAFMKEVSKMVLNQVKVNGKRIWISLLRIKKKWTLQKILLWKIDSLCFMKEIMNLIKSKAKEYLPGLLEIYTEVAIKMMREMDMEKWDGLMEVIILENGTEAFNMGTEKLFFQMELRKKDTSKTISI
jgi:hypothetical protein